ncbi:hypothetical protein Trydic_g18757 [Trypoxylus dichotomus]
MSTEEASVHYNEKGEVVFYDFRKPKYDDQQYYVGKGGNDQYYYQQNVAGRPVYVQGPPPPPINAARTPILRGRVPPEETYDERVFENSFNTTKIRHRFVRKVYLLLFTLLGFTSVVIAVFVFEENTNRFARRNILIGLGFLIASMVMYITIACVQTLRKQFPLNLFVLAIFTMFSSVGYGFFAACYSPEIVLYAAIITAGVCLLITLIACQPWIDITGWGMYLCIIGLVVMLFGMIAMIISLTTGLGRVLHIVYSSIVALLFSLYFMYTTQLILGGKKYEISPEEYVYGAIVLYVEVMTLFITIMQLFGLARQ